MPTPGFCSKCDGEIDAEGWCANYCMDDEPDDETRMREWLAGRSEIPTSIAEMWNRMSPLERLEFQDEAKRLLEGQRQLEDAFERRK